MKIHAIQTGVVHVKADFLRGSADAGSTARFMLRLLTDKRWVDLPIFAWVIEHDEGVIVVDTGDLSDTLQNFISQSTYTVRPEEEIGPQLESLGISPRDVSKVILTHLHGDHVNGLRFFEGVRVYLGADEYTYYKSRFGGMFSRRTTRLPAWFDPQPLAAEARAYGPFDRYFPITRAGDVVAVPTPGHTPGHISIIAVSDGISYFMAGDVTYDERGLLDQRLQGPSLDQAHHPETLRRVLKYVRTAPTLYLPSHDWESGQRLTQGQAVSPQSVAVG